MALKKTDGNFPISVGWGMVGGRKGKASARLMYQFFRRNLIWHPLCWLILMLKNTLHFACVEAKVFCYGS
jgi:hypothetical protein